MSCPKTHLRWRPDGVWGTNVFVCSWEWLDKVLDQLHDTDYVLDFELSPYSVRITVEEAFPVPAASC